MQSIYSTLNFQLSTFNFQLSTLNFSQLSTKKMEFGWIEIVGACTGATYLILEVRQNMWLWPVGLLNAIFYAVIFYSGGLYAIMTLQFYYMAMMIYGWYNWKKMQHVADESTESMRVIYVGSAKKWLILAAVTIAIWGMIYLLLSRFTDSVVPIWDALTTALSIVGTWMLAKKYIEQWYVWIFVNLFSIWLYATQGLIITAFLYGFYAIMAVVGLFRWRKNL